MINKFITQTQQWDYLILHKSVLIKNKQIIASFRLEETSDYNILNAVYVDEKHRSKGYGNLIVESALEQAKSNGYELLHLSVKKTNVPAIKLYKKYGFVLDGDASDSRYHWMKKVIE